MKRRIRLSEGQLRKVINKSVHRILNESVCPNKNRLFDLLDNGIINPSDLAEQLIKWISEDDAKRLIEIYGYDEYLGDEDNEEEF